MKFEKRLRFRTKFSKPLEWKTRRRWIRCTFWNCATLAMRRRSAPSWPAISSTTPSSIKSTDGIVYTCGISLNFIYAYSIFGFSSAKWDQLLRNVFVTLKKPSLKHLCSRVPFCKSRIFGGTVCKKTNSVPKISMAYSQSLSDVY